MYVRKAGGRLPQSDAPKAGCAASNATTGGRAREAGEATGQRYSGGKRDTEEGRWMSALVEECGKEGCRGNNDNAMVLVLMSSLLLVVGWK